MTPGARHVYHQYTIRVQEPIGRDVMARALRSSNIGCAVHYPIPLHRCPAYLTPLDLPTPTPRAPRSCPYQCTPP